jgi:hypothetical protein
MAHRGEADDIALEEFLWEIDVTSVRPKAESRRRHRPATATAPTPAVSRTPGPADLPAVEPASAGAPAPKTKGRGRFYRPELETPWQRLAGSRLVQIVTGVVLVGGTAALVAVALTR